jgi:hypothetical protein
MQVAIFASLAACGSSLNFATKVYSMNLNRNLDSPSFKNLVSVILGLFIEPVSSANAGSRSHRRPWFESAERLVVSFIQMLTNSFVSPKPILAKLYPDFK